MALSKADWELIEEVATYFEATKLTAEQLKEKRLKQEKRGYEAKSENVGSIQATAKHFNLTRTKVTKMLVTMGIYSTPLTRQVQQIKRPWHVHQRNCDGIRHFHGNCLLLPSLRG